jgi:hypothetical protein
VQLAKEYSYDADRKLIESSRIHLFIKKEADDWKSTMIGAAQGSNKNLVRLFIEKGAKIWIGHCVKHPEQTTKT